MNKYDKAVAEMHKAGLYSAHIAGGEGDIGVYVDCWNQDLEFTLSIRVHDEEINYYANQYDKNNETK